MISINLTLTNCAAAYPTLATVLNRLPTPQSSFLLLQSCRMAPLATFTQGTNFPPVGQHLGVPAGVLKSQSLSLMQAMQTWGNIAFFSYSCRVRSSQITWHMPKTAALGAQLLRGFPWFTVPSPPVQALVGNCNKVTQAANIPTTEQRAALSTAASPENEQSNELPAGLPKLFNSGMRLTTVAHRVWETLLREGDCAVDMTAGNGHDTIFLAKRVLPIREADGAVAPGRIWAFDVQVCRSNAGESNQPLSVADVKDTGDYQRETVSAILPSLVCSHVWLSFWKHQAFVCSNHCLSRAASLSCLIPEPCKWFGATFCGFVRNRMNADQDLSISYFGAVLCSQLQLLLPGNYWSAN